MKKLHLHIGLQKTGTSTIQEFFMRPNGPLEAQGIDYLPGAVSPRWAHHNAAWQAANHKRYLPDSAGLDELLEQARNSAQARLLVSSEDFSLLQPDQVVALAVRLTDFDVSPILCLRNQLDWAESMYAQACKRGNPGSFMAFTERLRQPDRVNLFDTYNAWATAFGRGKMQVMIYENDADACAAFAEVLGFPIKTPPARKNKSLNERFVQASQKVLRRCRKGKLSYGGRTILPKHSDLVAKTMLAIGAHHPEFSGSPVFLPRHEAQDYLGSFKEMNEKIAEHVALPEPYFTVSPTRRAPQPQSEADVEFLVERLFSALSADPV